MALERRADGGHAGRVARELFSLQRVEQAGAPDGTVHVRRPFNWQLVRGCEVGRRREQLVARDTVERSVHPVVARNPASPVAVRIHLTAGDDEVPIGIAVKEPDGERRHAGVPPARRPGCLSTYRSASTVNGCSEGAVSAVVPHGSNALFTPVRPLLTSSG